MRIWTSSKTKNALKIENSLTRPSEEVATAIREYLKVWGTTKPVEDIIDGK